MNRRPVLALTAAGAAVVVAGLLAVAVPAVMSLTSQAAVYAENIGEQLAPAQVDHRSSSDDDDDDDDPEDRVEVVPGYTAEKLEVAKAMPPQREINHPSRWAAGCTQNSHVTKATISGAPFLVDMGPREYASGPTTWTEGGLLESYTVQPNDALMAIGQRFCMDEIRLLQANDVYAGNFQPGTVLRFPTTPIAERFPYSREGMAQSPFLDASR